MLEFFKLHKKNISIQLILLTIILIFFTIHRIQNFQEEDKDINYTWVIKRQFQDAQPFSEGLAAVEIKKGDDYLYGYIDVTGKIIIKPQFKYADDFKNGMAIVTLFSGEKAVIDKNGEYILKPNYGNIKIVQKNGDTFFYINDYSIKGIIDINGQWVLGPFEYQHFLGYDNQLIAVSNGYYEEDGFNGFWYFINRQGKHVFDSTFEEAREFSEGLAAVKIDGLWGFINEQGNLEIKPQYIEIDSFSENLAPVCDVNHNWGYINKQGKLVIKNNFRKAYPFKNKLACVIDKNNKYGFIDVNGNFVVKPQFSKVDSYYFEEEVMFMEIDTKRWKLVSHTGEVLSDLEFENYLNFNGRDWAGVKINGKWGCIDKKGIITIKPEYEYEFSFSEGLAAVTWQGKCGYINKKGEFVIKPQFKWAHNFQEGLAAVCFDDSRKYGVVNINDYGYIKINN